MGIPTKTMWRKPWRILRNDLDAWDGYILYLMEANQIRIIYTLDVEHFGKINWIKAVNPIPEDKMQELRVFLEGNV